MRHFLLLLLLGTAATAGPATANPIADRTVSLLSAQTEQAGDVRPHRGNGRRRMAESQPVSGESFMDASTHSVR